MSGAVLTLPFATVARVALPHQLRSSLPQPSPHPDLPPELRNVFAAYIGCDTRILWKVHEGAIEAPPCSTVVHESPRSTLATSFAAALNSPMPSPQPANKITSPFAAALVRPSPPSSISPSPVAVATCSARATLASVPHSTASPKYSSVAQRVALALDAIKNSTCPGSRIGGLEREARLLLEHICSLQLQTESDDAHCRSTTVRPLVILHGCDGCGKRALIRAACAAVDPPILISELDCSSLPSSSDRIQNFLELHFASAARSQSAVLVTDALDVVTHRKFSSASASRFVTVLINFIMEKQRLLQKQSPCFITCLSPEFLDSNLRAFAVLELGVPSPSLQDRATITLLHLESMLHPSIAANIVSEFSSGGKLSQALALACETMAGYRSALLSLCVHTRVPRSIV